MIFRGIDSSGDWILGSGKNSYFTEEKAVEANIKTRLLSFLNDCFFDLEAGVDWWNLLGSRNSSEIILQTRTVIIQSLNVVNINSLDATFNSINRNLSLSYNIDTIYTQGIAGSISVP